MAREPGRNTIERDPMKRIAELEAALAAERAKGEAFAHLSHELRTLLAAAIGITGLLLETELSPEQRDYVKRVRSLSDALIGLVNDVLDHSRIEAGKFELEQADLDLRRLVDDVGEMLAERAFDKGIELLALVADDVPAALRGDPGRLRQVLINLVSNAIKFTDSGEVIVRVSLEEATEEAVRVRIEVRDTGVGISPEGIARLFQPFTQVHEGGREYGGSGLGLALSQEIVKAMGGSIGVDSAPGAGSVFRFSVRFERRPAARSAIPRVDVAGRRVLCAVPNAACRAWLGEMIQALGVECGSADDGERALELLRSASSLRRAYDVVLLDVSLPGAAALFRAVEEESPLAGLRVVLLSYPGQRLHDDDSVAPGPSRAQRPVTQVAKPVRKTQLYACLRTLMGSTVETVAEVGLWDAAPESRRGGKSSSRGPASVRFEGPASTPRPRAGRDAPRALPAEDRPLILVVEDNEVNQRVSKAMMEKRGYRVDLADNGEEAITATALAEYTAVFMDCQMPRVDGYAATAAIRERDAGRPRLPIIAMTANAGPGARERCLAAGMDDYVSKPVTPEAIDAALRRWAPLRGPAAKPPAARRPSSPAVDLAMLRQIRETQQEGDPDIVGEVVAIFLRDAPERIAAIRAAVADHDIVSAGRTAHTLKGSAGHLGAKTLSMLCARFEDKARAGAPFDVVFAVSAIEEELARVRDALDLELRKDTADRRGGEA